LGEKKIGKQRERERRTIIEREEREEYYDAEKEKGFKTHVGSI
jgi:hypothetical protein